MADGYKNDKNPNEGQRPFGKYKTEMPRWILRQIEKGNRGRRHLSKFF